jgi:hypothetical protein
MCFSPSPAIGMCPSRNKGNKSDNTARSCQNRGRRYGQRKFEDLLASPSAGVIIGASDLIVVDGLTHASHNRRTTEPYCFERVV